MLNIQVAKGTGVGPTKLAAFDDALHKIGVYNYNLIALSSVIPPESKVIVHENRISQHPGEWGDRLYVVMAEARSDTPNQEIWAGIGWVQDKKSGKGLFVEHVGMSEKTVRNDINASLDAIMKTRRDVEFGKINMVVNGAVCKTKPVCTAVVAAYQTTGWDNTYEIYK